MFLPNVPICIYVAYYSYVREEDEKYGYIVALKHISDQPKRDTKRG